MRTTLFRTNGLVLVCIGLLFAVTSRARGQAHDRFENVCPELQDAAPPDLLQYLNETSPNGDNAWCVTWAIHKLGKEHYEPAIPALVKLLDFRRPQTRTERIAHGLSQYLFPAKGALELFGRRALPYVLRAIEADTTSNTARDNAAVVWIVAYQSDHPKGVAALKQEQLRVTDDAIKSRLESAIEVALKHCTSKEGAACRKAAVGGAP